MRRRTVVISRGDAERGRPSNDADREPLQVEYKALGASPGPPRLEDLLKGHERPRYAAHTAPEYEDGLDPESCFEASAKQHGN